jgi:hypothetical protein
MLTIPTSLHFFAHRFATHMRKSFHGLVGILTDVLRRLPAILPTDSAAIRPLLPDQWAQAHSEHIHASRDEELRADNARRNKCRAKRR